MNEAYGDGGSCHFSVAIVLTKEDSGQAAGLDPDWSSGRVCRFHPLPTSYTLPTTSCASRNWKDSPEGIVI